MKKKKKNWSRIKWKEESTTKLKCIMITRQFLRWLLLRVRERLCRNTQGFCLSMSVLASSSPPCPNYGIPAASLINNYTASTRRDASLAFSDLLLSSSDEWHLTRSPWTQPQLSLKYISHLCTHFGFSGVTHIYRAEEASLLTFQRLLCYLIFLFKTCFGTSTFLKGDLSWSPELMPMKLEKVLKEDMHFRVESLVMKDDVGTHCSHSPFIHKKWPT